MPYDFVNESGIWAQYLSLVHNIRQAAVKLFASAAVNHIFPAERVQSLSLPHLGPVAESRAASTAALLFGCAC